MYLPAPNESSFAPTPAGTHLALCYRVIDLGTQESNYNGEMKKAHKVLLSWELPDELMEDGRPFTVNQRFTWSMHEKATLRKYLEAWRGLAFTERDFGPSGFDIRNVLGKACTLNVVHNEKAGSTYTNVAGVGKPMKGITIPTATINPLVYLWLHKDRWDATVFASLSAGIQQAITKSPEYSDLMYDLHQASGQDDGGRQNDFHDDQIPF